MTPPHCPMLAAIFVAMACNATVREGCAENGEDPAEDASTSTAEVRMPTYATDGRLERITDWEQWVFLGASLNLSYVDPPSTTDLFANVFMEPTAFDHFRETGEFREGTMTALAVYPAATGDPPARSGQYAGEQMAFEMSVKDSSREPQTAWAYYSFGTASTASAQAAAACFSCHDQSAQTDHVFTQFYPVLRRP